MEGLPYFQSRRMPSDHPSERIRKSYRLGTISPPEELSSKPQSLGSSLRLGFMLTLSDARGIISAAEKRASEIGQPMNTGSRCLGGLRGL